MTTENHNNEIEIIGTDTEMKIARMLESDQNTKERSSILYTRLARNQSQNFRYIASEVEVIPIQNVGLDVKIEQK